MKNKSTTDNYNPSGKGKNSTDNKKDGPLDENIKGRHPARIAYDELNKSKAKEPRANPKDFPKYSKTTKSAVSFREATRAAKRKGQKTFTWEGRRYNTDEK